MPPESPAPRVYPCPKCPDGLGRPQAVTAGAGGTRIALRCDACQHEWEVPGVPSRP